MEQARAQREAEAKQQEAEAKRQELELQLQIEQEKAQGHNNSGDSVVAMKSPLHNFSKFEEKDGMDAFLERLERFAQNQR